MYIHTCIHIYVYMCVRNHVYVFIRLHALMARPSVFRQKKEAKKQAHGHARERQEKRNSKRIDLRKQPHGGESRGGGVGIA